MKALTENERHKYGEEESSVMGGIRVWGGGEGEGGRDTVLVQSAQ